MKKLICLIWIGLWISSVAFARDAIEFQHKRLKRSLKKFDIEGFESLRHIRIPDSLNNNYYINGRFFHIASANNPMQYVYVGRVNSCRSGGCSASGTGKQQGATSEYFDYFMFLDQNRAVQFVKVFNYQATHGYEIMSGGWLRQFEGYSGDDPLQVGTQIDGISGATISVHAITADINEKLDILNAL